MLVAAPGAQPDESELIERILAGDQAAFEQLYDRYLPRVFGFVQKRLDNRADTEETVQEVFFHVFSCLASYRKEAHFAAWVLGIARRTVANRFKRKRHPTVPLEIEDELENVDYAAPMIGAVPTPHETYECRERAERIEAAAALELTSEQRLLFELHHLRHHPITDIASLLDKSEDAIKSNLYRARRVLLAR
ncbi:MAG TPA: RNA polymerase sigma factor [Myxococcota bacterium]|jgi:RNA polymerase sigma-70 factor (ECF subfamily)|nr:RNA polymerase sigma factor [Myxococcota bacterium]